MSADGKDMDASLIAGIVGGIVSAALLGLIVVVLWRTRKLNQSISVSHTPGTSTPVSRLTPLPDGIDNSPKMSRQGSGGGGGGVVSRTITMDSTTHVPVSTRV